VIGFFDRWLRKGGGEPVDKPVRIFVMGANEWWEAETWPLPEAEPRPMYLRSHGDRRLLALEPPDEETPDQYRHDPLEPVTSAWSMHAGPVDDREIAAHPDVLAYTSEPLQDDIDVAGRPVLVLFAASSAPDVDWHVRLVDVHDDGSMLFVSHGVMRARFRDSIEQPTLLTPGETYRFAIPLTPTAIRFRAGHRIGVEIMSSWFPRFERNMCSGAANNLQDDDARVATQTVRHDSKWPSRLVLPVIPAGSYRAAEFAPR
jgi:putative CocE/NonD family hydrolase